MLFVSGFHNSAELADSYPLVMRIAVLEVVVVLVLVFVVDDPVDVSVMEVLLSFSTPSRGQFSVQYPHLPE